MHYIAFCSFLTERTKPLGKKFQGNSHVHHSELIMKLIKKVILVSVFVGACNMVQASQLDDCKQAFRKDDSQNAIKLCLEPAKRGDVEAQARLMVAYGDLKSYHQQLKWAKKLAAQGNVHGLFMLGIHYFEGVTIKKDYEKAKKLWNQACEAGYSPACEYLQRNFN